MDFEGSEESNDETVTSSQVAIDTKYTNLSKNQMTSLCGNLAEVTGSNPVEALVFFRLLLSNCLNWKIYCDDHISLSSTTAVQNMNYFI